MHGVQVWENLKVISEQFPVDGNKGGSYLTMLSKGGFVFGIINIIGNFGTVYNDQVSQPCQIHPGWHDWPQCSHAALSGDEERGVCPKHQTSLQPDWACRGLSRAAESACSDRHKQKHSCCCMWPSNASHITCASQLHDACCVVILVTASSRKRHRHRHLCPSASAHGSFCSCRSLLQGYWQSAIAARPSAAHTGYLLGGIMWFCIPFTLATTMGLSALALDLPITLDEAGAGA